MGSDHRETMNEIAESLVQGGLARPYELRGCSEEEIKLLEKTLHVQLPSAYRAFLERLGCNAGSFMRGSDFLCADVARLNQVMQRKLGESRDGANGEDVLGFLSHQDYEFLFFPLSAEDDPPVFHFLEGERAQQVFEHFSEWLKSAIRDEVTLEQELSSGRPGTGPQ